MNDEKDVNGNASPLNLRKLLGIDQEYVAFCREERNFAAVLYHLLLDAGRLRSFLELIGQNVTDLNVEQVRIYFEYAHLRDLWTEVGTQGKKDIKAKNGRYRAAIVAMLRMPDALTLPDIDKDEHTGEDDCTAFNTFFTGNRVAAASKDHIQMPSRWSDSQFNFWRDEHGKEFAARACSLKWAFNAKPDLVLHLGKNKAICIEAKLESGVGRYQVKSDTNPKGCFSKTQLELQEFILKDLLGYDMEDKDFVVVSKKKRRKEADSASKWRAYSWQDVFEKVLREHPPTDMESHMVKLFRESKIINRDR